MPDNTDLAPLPQNVTVYDTQANQPVAVPADQAAQLLQSGRYRNLEGSTKYATPGGPVYRSGAEAQAAQTAGEVPVGNEVEAQASRTERRRKMFDTTSDRAFTFAEGVTDALTFGLIHEHGEAADIRRDVNSGYALAGQLTGLGLGLKLPHIGAVADLGEGAGRLATKAVLGDVAEGSRAAVLQRAAEEAGVNAALVAAGSFGHQVSDAVIEDKPFATEAIINDVKVAGLLGFGVGLAGGALSRAASRADVRAQGGLLDAGSDTSKSAADNVRGAIEGWDQSARVHEVRLGVLKQLAAEGHLPGDAMAERSAALADVQKAKAALDKFNVDRALDGAPKDYQAFRGALDNYQVASEKLDELMRPRWQEELARAKLNQMGAGQPGADFNFNPVNTAAGEGASPMAFALDQAMEEGVPEKLVKHPRYAGSAENAGREMVAPGVDNPMQRYRDIYGRDYQPMHEALDEGPREPGGVVTPTSEEATNASKRGARPAAERPVSESMIEGEHPAPLEGTQVVEPGQIEAEHQPWQPSAPAGKFSMSDFSPDTLAGERPAALGRELNPRLNDQAHQGDLLNNQARPGVQLTKLPDGFMLPSRDAQAVAHAFESFQDKMADTVMRGGRTEADLGATHPAEPGVDTQAATRGEARTVVDQRPELGRTQLTPERRLKAEARFSGRQAVGQYLDQWYNEARALGPRLSPGDAAAARLRSAMRQLDDASGGRFNSTAALELGEKLGLTPARGPLVEQLDQLWSMRRAAEYAADVTRGKANKLTAQGNAHVKNWLERRLAGGYGAQLGRKVLGSAGGPLGYAMGVDLLQRLNGTTGRIAASAGRMYAKTVKTAAALLRGRRSTMVVQALTANRPHAYSDAGPIKDPIERIQELKRMAAQPEAIRQKVLSQLGDVAIVHPDLANNLASAAAIKMQALSMRAPAIYFNQLGLPIHPPDNVMRRWFEYENAAHDLDGLLDSVAGGRATQMQAAALREQWPVVHAEITRGILKDQEGIMKASADRRRAVELITGFRLSSQDPGRLARTQAAWTDSALTRQMGQQGQPAQALKIHAEPPTVAQAQDKAPGNQ